MSLIEEALRRVQTPGVKPPSTSDTKTERPASPPIHSWPTDLPAPRSSQPAPPQATNKALVAIAASIIGLTAVLVIGGVFWIGRAVGTGPGGWNTVSIGTPPMFQRPDASSNEAPPKNALQPSRPASQNAPQPRVVLNGVVEGLGEPYAVINGAIVGLGESFEGATLVAIKSRSATLRGPDGRETLLELDR